MAGHNVSIKNLRGEQGSHTVTDGSVEGQFANFVAITDVTITAIEMPKEEGDVAQFYGVTYPQGFIFDGPIFSATVTGTARFYNFIDPSKEAARRTIQGA